MIAVIAGGVALRSRPSDEGAASASRIEVRREARAEVATASDPRPSEGMRAGPGPVAAAGPSLDSDSAGTIDLNTAGLVELDRLPGIGEARAEAILRHRMEIGRFESVDQLDAIPGIGPVTLEKLRPFVRVDPVGPASAASPVDADAVAPVAPAVASKAAQPPPVRPSVVADAPSPRSEDLAPASLDPVPSAPHERLVDINRATLEELDTLPGIGPALAKRILEFRATRPFRRPEDLIEVSGIGPKTFEKMRPRVVVRP